VIGQATTIGRVGGSEATEDDSESGADTTASTSSNPETNLSTTNSTETSLESSTTPPEVQSPVLGQTDANSLHQVIESRTYKVFHRFGQAKFAYCGSILGSNKFTLLPQLPLKIMLNLKLVKIGTKIIILVC